MGDLNNIQWHFACKVTEIVKGEILGVNIESTPVLISLFAGKYGAISDICPHMGALLSGGHITDGYVVCPFHGWQFCHISGEMGDRCDEMPYYQVDVRGDDIYIGITNDIR